MAVTIDKSTLTLVALALLIVVVVFQAVQINGIKAQIATGAIVSTGSTTGFVSGSSTASAGSSAPSSLDSFRAWLEDADFFLYFLFTELI